MQKGNQPVRVWNQPVQTCIYRSCNSSAFSKSHLAFCHQFNRFSGEVAVLCLLFPVLGISHLLRNFMLRQSFLSIKSLSCGGSGGHWSWKFPSPALRGEQEPESQLCTGTGCTDIRSSWRSQVICLITYQLHIHIFSICHFHSNRNCQLFMTLYKLSPTPGS